VSAAFGLHDDRYATPLLPDGAAGIDAGLTLTKIVRGDGAGVIAEFSTATDAGRQLPDVATLGVTGAHAHRYAAQRGSLIAPEIEAGATGVRALLRSAGVNDDAFVLALLGTGTSFAAVGPGRASHLGGAALGGGSFIGIAGRVAPGMAYVDMIERAARGDRRRADTLVGEAYAEGVGRIGAEMTAAHVNKPGASVDDFLAGLLNMHGESIGQIAASRARIAGLSRVVLAGGFVHGNAALTKSIAGMVRLFGVECDVSPWPGFAVAAGAALIAAEGSRT
jgi:hypothetical protein